MLDLRMVILVVMMMMEGMVESVCFKCSVF